MMKIMPLLNILVNLQWSGRYNIDWLVGHIPFKPIEQLLGRSGRVPHQPNRYYGFLIRDGNPIELDENNEYPITYMEAM